MAEATTADLLKVQKDTNKRVTFIGNVLNKNIVPASQQKERDTEDNAFKHKLVEGMLSIKDSLKNMAKRTLQVAGFPIAIIMGAIAFIIAFFTQIGKELAKLKKVVTVIKNLPQIIAGFFSAIRGGLVAAREAVVAKLAGALKAFKGTDGFKKLASGLDDLADVYRLARESVVLKLKNALAAFKENAVIKAIGGAFVRMRMLLNAAKGYVIGLLKGALTAFKENAVVKAIGGAFKTIAGFFGRAIGVGKGVTGGIIGAVRGAMVAFRETAVFKAIGGIGKVLAGAFSGVLSLIGGAAKAGAGAKGAGAKVGKGIVGAISKVTGAIGGMVSTIGKFTGLSKIVTFAKGFGATLGKLLWPVTIIIGLFDFIKGFRKDEGWDGEPATIFDKIGMGISEALQGLIGLPLDMIKAGILWVLGKFGIGKTKDPVTGEEMESAWMTKMKAFSFSDLIDKLIAGLWAGIGAVFDWVMKLFTDPVGAIVDLAKGYVSMITGIGKWLYDNAIEPIFKWIKGIFGFGEDKDKAPAADGDTKEIEKQGWMAWVMEKILPKGLVDFIKAPMATILGWIGLGGDTTTDGDTKPKELEGATGKPEGGWFSAMLGAIFSPTLLLFLLGPVGWILGFLGFIVKAAGATGDTGLTGDAALDGAKGKGEKNMFAKFLEKILPPGLIAFVTDPVDWLLKFIGWKDAEGKTTDTGTAAAGIIVGGSWKEKVGLFNRIISSIITQWMKDFMSGPIDFIKAKLGWTTTEDTTATSFFDDWKLPSWDSFKELLPEWLSDPVGWVTGLFKKGEKVGAEEKARIEKTSLATEEAKKSQKTSTTRNEQRIFLEEEVKQAQADLKVEQDKRLATGQKLRDVDKDIDKYLAIAEEKMGKEMSVKDIFSGLSFKGLDKSQKVGLQQALKEQRELEKLPSVGKGKEETKLEKEIAKYDAQLLPLQETMAEDQRIAASSLDQLVQAALKKKESLAVHDRHVERAIYGLMQGAAAQTALLAAYGNGGSGGSSTTVNNVTVAPSTSNTVSSVQKSENTYGTVDPYTSASGAYG